MSGLSVGSFRRTAAVAVLALLLASPALPASYRDYAASLVRNLPHGAAFRPDLERELASLANAYRAGKGRKPLAASEHFLAAARAHAADMMVNGFLGHRASTGHGLEGRIAAFVEDRALYPAIAENVARDLRKSPVDSAKARSLFALWVKSSGHRRNLASRSHAYVSTAVVQRGNEIYAVQIFWAEPRPKTLFQ
jgi:uncharacterized protein YkwD